MAGSPHIILVVDDDPGVRQSLMRVLQAHGYRAIGAGSCSEALREALAQPPDVIVMDLMMPERSGLDTIRALRSQPPLASVRAIALTAGPVVPDDAASLFQRILLKPCSSADLLGAIRADDGHSHSMNRTGVR